MLGSRRLMFLQHRASFDNTATFWPIDNFITLYVQYNKVKKEFHYFTVDNRLTKPGVNDEGSTDLTMQQAIDLLQ